MMMGLAGFCACQRQQPTGKEKGERHNENDNWGPNRTRKRNRKMVYGCVVWGFVLAHTMTTMGVRLWLAGKDAHTLGCWGEGSPGRRGVVVVMDSGGGTA